MLDLGWWEFMVIAIVTVLVVGPKELPRVFRTITGFMRKARSLAGEFHSAMDDMAREADLADLKNEVEKVKTGESDWIKEIDPTGEVDKSVKDMKSELDQTRRAVNNPGSALTTKPEPRKPGEPIAGTGGAQIGGAAPKQAEPAKKAGAGKTATAKTASKKAATRKTVAKKTAGKSAPRKTAAKKAPTGKTAGKSEDAKA